MELPWDNLILFDGLCNLCSRTVQFIIRNDRLAIYKFASIQSEIGQNIYRHHGLNPDDAQTFLLLSKGKVFLRSDAAIEMVRQFGGIWRLASLFKVLPRWFRDWLYSILARNRYRWFGRREHCIVPTDEIKGRFLG